MKQIALKIIWILFLFISFGLSYPGQIIKHFSAPYRHCTGLTYDGKNLWVADHGEDKLICMNPETGKILRQIPSPGFWPAGLAWDGQYLWNVDLKQRKIFQIDPKDGTILKSIDAPSSNPEGLTWDGETLWVSDGRARRIMRIDLSDGTAVKHFPAPARNPQGLTWDGRYLWCSDRLMDEIYMIDPENGEVILIIQSPAPYSRGLAFDGKNLWNVDYQTDKIYKLIREDDETYILKNTRHALVTFTHEVKAAGKGRIKDLDVFIAVPEKLPQQEILKISFNPKNHQLVSDQWGQKVAHFHYQNITSGKSVRSIMKVETRISDISYFIFPDKCGSLADIPAEILKKYTSDESKYQVNDPYIQELAKKIVGDEQNPYWIARKIFDYVRNHLEYQLEGGWNIAPVVLKRGTGSCSEYSFSFIALCRAAGLPARYVGSIVVRGDDASLDEVFHRWPEVYLPNYGWIPIDPQGGDKPSPRDRALNIGHLSNRFLITTQSGGNSRYLGWYYNSNEHYSSDPQVTVHIEAFGDWQPIIQE